MTQEQRFFLKVLSDHLAGRKTVLVEGLNWNLIATYANMQQMGSIVEAQCIDFMPKQALNSLKQKRGVALYYFANYKNTINEISLAFCAADISFFIVKGLDVAQYYPVPALRIMGDCDIVVHHKQMRDAIAIVKQIGFLSESADTAQQWGASRNGLNLELHDVLVQHGEFVNHRQRRFFNKFEQYVKDGALDRSFHFLFLLMHLRKHFLNYGVGFRQFMDLAVMVQKESALEWHWIEEKLLVLKLRDFAHTCYALLDLWFNISVPVGYARLDRDLYEQITGLVFSGGVFGMNDINNLNNAAKTSLAKAKGSIRVKRLWNIIRAIFPSYQMMRGYNGCEYIYDKPYLLPVAWVHRLIMLLRRYKSNPGHKENNILISDAEVADRRKLLKRMGL